MGVEVGEDVLAEQLVAAPRRLGVRPLVGLEEQRPEAAVGLVDEVLDELGVKDPLLDLAMELEKIALNDDYFVSRKLYPNVDFYSGIILKAMGFPISMFTVLFAVARTVGWISQWCELVADPTQKIGRPRQLYTGEGARPYVPLNKRK